MMQLRLEGQGTSTYIPPKMYSTRFQGSKRSISSWLIPLITEDSIKTVLDGFSGSGIVSYLLAHQDKQITSCDILYSSFFTTKCFLADRHIPESDVVSTIGEYASEFSIRRLGKEYSGLFYLDEELEWLDGATEIIRQQDLKHQASLYWPLFQAALSKRPYNLFHRSNLSMRTRNVARSFGNKKTWDTPFPVLFNKFISEAQKHILFDKDCSPHVGSPEDFSNQQFDLIYLDPPYINARGQTTPYNDYYSFLDILCRPELQCNIDHNKNHKPLTWKPSTWNSPGGILQQLHILCEQHATSRIAFSYRSDGVPTPTELYNVLTSDQRRVRLEELPMKYVLAKSSAHEIVVVSDPA